MATQLKLTWMDDLKAESDLRRMAVIFEVVTISFSEIDLKESQYNGARFGDAIIETLVDDYTQGMVNGDTFPRIVVYQSPSGYVVASGNQRCETIARLIRAKRLPKSLSIEAYVVDTTDQFLLEIIARAGNVGHGGRSEKAERTHNALHCIQRLGMSIVDASRTFNIATTTIQLHIRAEKKQNELADEGIDTTRVPRGTLNAIAKIGDSNLETKLGHLVVQHGPSLSRVDQVAKSVKKAKSHAARIAKIKEFERELTQQEHRENRGHVAKTNGRSKVPRRPRRDRIIGDLTKLANWLDSGLQGEPFFSLSDFQIADEEDRKVVRNAWNRIEVRMKKLIRTK